MSLIVHQCQILLSANVCTFNSPVWLFHGLIKMRYMSYFCDVEKALTLAIKIGLGNDSPLKEIKCALSVVPTDKQLGGLLLHPRAHFDVASQDIMVFK